MYVCTTREAPHKQNYDQGGRITNREPTHKQNYDRGAGWLVGWWNYDQGACHALGWLAGWQGGWLAGWRRPREAQRVPERRSVGLATPKSRPGYPEI